MRAPRKEHLQAGLAGTRLLPGMPRCGRPTGGAPASPSPAPASIARSLWKPEAEAACGGHPGPRAGQKVRTGQAIVKGTTRPPPPQDSEEGEGS